jgi:hypothetical protein
VNPSLPPGNERAARALAIDLILNAPLFA